MNNRICSLILLSGLVASLQTHGCIQRYGTTVDGDYIRSVGYSGRNILTMLTNFPSYEHWTADEASLKPLAVAPSPDFKVVSDRAADLLHLGKVEEAIEELEPLVEKMPNEYPLVANLGTAYELGGQLDKALDYTSRAIAINPDSHFGSEWLHVKIIQARLALAKDPKWLQTHTVLGLDFGAGKTPSLPAELKGQKNKLKELIDAITYQLHERLQFVEAPNPIVADLLFDLGNIVALNDIVESALPVYEFSLKYGDIRQPLAIARIAYCEKLAHHWSMEKILQKYPQMTALVFFAIAALGFIPLHFHIERRRRAQANA